MRGDIVLKIDGKEVKAREGQTILEAAEEMDIEIPTLCHHEKLLPYGACRICSVEVESKGRTRIVASCGYPVEQGINVRTRSPRIDKIRRTIIELIAPLMSDVGIVGKIREIADEYGADTSRFMPKFKAKPTRCILCGQCVRYCAEVIGANAIGFVGRGIDRRIVFFPEKAARYCSSCQECFYICPTGKIAAETTGDIFPGLSIADYISGE